MYKVVMLAFLPSVLYAQAPGLLRVSGINPRYLVSQTDTNKAVYMTGFHFWDNAIDAGDFDPPEIFPYTAYLDSMARYGHNFIRLWSGWHNSNKVVEWSGNFWFGQNPYSRPGPGNANDGKPKFDLNSFDNSFFTRMRNRCIEAGQRGMYVAVQMFNGWVTNSPSHGFGASNPWITHPYNVANNINGIDGDSDNDGNGEETQRSPYSGGGGIQSIWSVQVAYMKRMIDELNDLDNIIWETSNEAEDMDGTNRHYAWSRLVIDTIHAYEQRKPTQHLVWYTGDWGIVVDSQFVGPAECIAPGGNPASIPWDDAPPDSGGRKVVIQDTDHTFGMLNVNGVPLAWKNFTSGQDGIVLQDNAFGCWHVWACDDPLWPPFKRAMGQTAVLAGMADLLNMTPQPNKSSTSNDVLFGRTTGEVIVYQQSGVISVDLTEIPDSLNVMWFDPDDFVTTAGAKVAGGGVRSFTPPLARYDVLYLYAGESTSPAPSSPSLISPQNSATGQPLDISLLWNVAPNATTYDVQLALDSGFFLVAFQDSFMIDTSRTFTGLAPGETHFWRVRGRNQLGVSQWSSAWSFSTLILPPIAPFLVEPSDLSTGQSLNPILTWRHVSGADSYDVQLSFDPGFSSLIMSDSLLVDTTQQAGNLSNGTIYYWRARSRNVAGLSGWTIPWSFTTTLQLPGQVQLVSPIDQAVLNSDTVSFNWYSSTPNVTNYWIEGSTDSLFTSSVVDSTLADTTITIPGVPIGVTYFWRVRGKNSIGWGQFSGTRSFVVLQTAVRDDVFAIPTQVHLEQNYPNPFNPETVIRFSLPSFSDVTLDVFTIHGRRIATLAAGRYSAGWHSVRWDGMTNQNVRASSGVYIYSLRSGTASITKKLLLLR